MTVDDMECHLAALDTHIEDLVASRDCFKNKLKLSKPHIPLPGIDFDPSMTSTAREKPMTVGELDWKEGIGDNHMKVYALPYCSAYEMRIFRMVFSAARKDSWSWGDAHIEGTINNLSRKIDEIVDAIG